MYVVGSSNKPFFRKLLLSEKREKLPFSAKKGNKIAFSDVYKSSNQPAIQSNEGCIMMPIL
jgi:hypothetical protein